MRVLVSMLVACAVFAAPLAAEAQAEDDPAGTTARIGQFVIRGSMAREDIARVLSNSLASLSFCAESNGGADVTLIVVVGPTGVVASASGEGPAPLVLCIVRTARRWRFPQTGAGITTFEVPITFASR